MSKPTVIIADDHPLLLKGLEDLLIENDIEVLATANNGNEAFSKIEEFHPQLAILDMEMPYKTGLEIAEACKKLKIPTKIILLTLHKELYLFHQAKELNLSGYLLKEFALTELSKAIETVLNGNQFFSEKLFENQESDIADLHQTNLTPSEKKILRLIAEGLSSKEIADKLFIAERTVDKHRSNVIAKLKLEKKHNSLLLWAQKNRDIIN
ncbi:DNA-binding NarL/FixJ family response regulator [Algoriphagus iocasae]|jgi:DNA-binding NarL/FixJ family response regulator|uniref:DNA-binding NarL/FixJ family response regulator n=1 Tax=Algoriphagus iocasae TaxID=1836499 RepID=A0A841MY33_9BACT|nr:response regulator transcription factor [Algoriphagus iocasae]MBB6326911.1 DNA-binding NarL/FixJ family response regulator [Algoriphagus iocasae]